MTDHRIHQLTEDFATLMEGMVDKAHEDLTNEGVTDFADREVLIRTALRNLLASVDMDDTPEGDLGTDLHLMHCPDPCFPGPILEGMIPDPNDHGEG